MFQCNVCGKGFSRNPNLLTHVKTVHLGLKRVQPPRTWSCDLCSKSLSSKRSYKEHMNIHNRVRPHVCAYCQYSATNESTLRRHVMRKHTAGDLLRYPCPYCGVRLVDSTGYLKHLESVHPNQSGTFGCTGCDFETLSRSYFEEHQAKHRLGGIFDKQKRPVFITNNSPESFLVDDEFGVGYRGANVPDSRDNSYGPVASIASYSKSNLRSKVDAKAVVVVPKNVAGKSVFSVNVETNKFRKLGVRSSASAVLTWGVEKAKDPPDLLDAPLTDPNCDPFMSKNNSPSAVIRKRPVSIISDDCIVTPPHLLRKSVGPDVDLNSWTTELDLIANTTRPPQVPIESLLSRAKNDPDVPKPSTVASASIVAFSSSSSNLPQPLSSSFEPPTKRIICISVPPRIVNTISHDNACSSSAVVVSSSHAVLAGPTTSLDRSSELAVKLENNLEQPFQPTSSTENPKVCSGSMENFSDICLAPNYSWCGDKLSSVGRWVSQINQSSPRTPTNRGKFEFTSQFTDFDSDRESDYSDDDETDSSIDDSEDIDNKLVTLTEVLDSALNVKIELTHPIGNSSISYSDQPGDFSKIDDHTADGLVELELD